MESAKVILLLLAVGFIECADEGTVAYRSHVKMLKNYPCDKPQPRVFEAKDVIAKDLYGEGEIKPVVTVLHRCNNTGCCQNEHERCTAAKTEPVVLTFYIVHNSAIKYLDVKLTNHTQCSCSVYHAFNATVGSEAEKTNTV